MKSSSPPEFLTPYVYYVGIIFCAYLLWAYYHDKVWDDYYDKRTLISENIELSERLLAVEQTKKVVKKKNA